MAESRHGLNTSLVSSDREDRTTARVSANRAVAATAAKRRAVKRWCVYCA
jgi:hypothetical protein